MSKSKLFTVCFALLVAMNLFSVAAFAGIRNYGTPYTDVGGTTWSGTQSFYNDIYGNGTQILSGAVDWIVYGPGEFPYDDSGYDPSNQYTYVYQIRNLGNVALSDFTVNVTRTVENIDTFISPSRVEGDLASFTDFYLGKVEWGFDGLNPATSSAGLVFRSPKAPETTDTGRVINGGHIAALESLPVPGPNDIPEPGTIVLLLAGLALVPATRRIFHR